MLCCELFRLLNFHIFKGSLKAISITIVSHSSCTASPKLSVTAGLLSDILQRAQGQSFSNVETEIYCGKKPSAIQLVSLGACVTSYPNSDWSLGPMTICPLISHLFKHYYRPTKQLQISPQCHSLAFTMEKLNDSERCFKLFIYLLSKVSQMPFFYSFNPFCFFFIFFTWCLPCNISWWPSPWFWKKREKLEHKCFDALSQDTQRVVFSPSQKTDKQISFICRRLILNLTKCQTKNCKRTAVRSFQSTSWYLLVSH